MANIKGISPSIIQYQSYLGKETKPTRNPQRRLNPGMKEVVKKEILKLLDNRIIYPISNSLWVSPIQVVPKKSDVIVIPNETNELVPTRV